MSAASFAALLALLSGLLAGCGDQTYVAPKPTAAASIDPGEATATLAALQTAVRRGDADAARALGSDDGSGEQLAAMASNVRAIGLADVSLIYLTENGGGSFDGAWGATVQVTWRVKGFDRRRASTEVDVSFADGGHRISAVGDDEHQTPLWLTGPIDVRRTADVLVLGAGSTTLTDRVFAESKVAIARDHAVLGAGSRVVVEVPRSVAQLQRALGVRPPDYADIAGVTAPVDGNRLPGTPVHVFINPSVYRMMKPVAAQVVMTHESVHAVTDAPLTTGAPLWLVEGFADWVALGGGRASALPLSRTAGQISERVRQHGAPRALPADGDFANARHLGATYEAAWLVCVTIADHAGGAALIRLYHDALGGTPIERALADDTGLSLGSLTQAWRSRLAVTAASLS
ncbi:hypothetical protein [Nocardioides montaniterrae]